MNVLSDSGWTQDRFQRKLDAVLNGERWTVFLFISGSGVWLKDETRYVLLGTGDVVIGVPQEILDLAHYRSIMEMPIHNPGSKSRRTDPATSKRAAHEITMKANSSRAKLLSAHLDNQNGLTDEEAASEAGLSLSSEYATRCSELERAGLIDSMSHFRTGSSGQSRVVRKITVRGIITAQEVRSNA